MRLDLLVDGDHEQLAAHSWLIDASASPVLLNALGQATLPEGLRCCRVEIADGGRLGFLSVEGPDRNPRLDDLQVALFDLATQSQTISRWLRLNEAERNREAGSRLEEINVGLSCSSETMRLADELVSFHAATFASGLRRYVLRGHDLREGRLQISAQDDGDAELLALVQQHVVRPVVVLGARNDPTWEVRFADGPARHLQRALARHAPDETGGLLIGLVSYNRRIIYVTRALPAPPDSRGSPYAFIRGVQDVPEEVFGLQARTGGMLGYVGEWHTHPKGDPELSDIDLDAVGRIRRNLDTIPLPTHVMTVTRRGSHPHVFSRI